LVSRSKAKSQIKYLENKRNQGLDLGLDWGETEEFLGNKSQIGLSYDKNYPIDTWGLSLC